jgi:hypothetical protein
MRLTDPFPALEGPDAGRRPSLANRGRRALCRGATMTSLAVALPAGQGVRAAEPVLPAPSRLSGPWDMIAFEVKSWGRPVTSWRLLRNGKGSWTETRPKAGAPSAEQELFRHEAQAGLQGYAQIERGLARLPDPAPDARQCRHLIHDLPYGTIRLSRGATALEIEWNSGCMDEDYRVFVDILKAADPIVAKWGRAGRTLRTEPLR